MLVLLAVFGAALLIAWVRHGAQTPPNLQGAERPGPRLGQSAPGPPPAGREPDADEARPAVSAEVRPPRELQEAVAEMLRAEPASGPIDLGEKGIMYRVGSANRPVMMGVPDADGNVAISERVGVQED